MRNRKPRLGVVPGAALSALDAAKSLSPEDLKRLLDEKSPPSPEEERKSAVQAILSQAEQMPGEMLAQFVQTHRQALLALDTLNIKRNLASFSLNAQELDGLLLVFDKLSAETKTDLATRAQQGAVAAGLPQQQLQAFATKLTRMGLHL